MKLPLNWGHASAQQLKRVLVDSDGNHAHLLTRVDEALAPRDVCLDFEKAPHAPAAGASTGATFSVKLQLDFLFPTTSLRRMLWMPSPYIPS